MKKKIITIVLITTIIILNFSNIVFGASIGDIFSEGDAFVSQGESDQSSTINTDNLKSGMNFMYVVFVSAGVLVAIVVGMILGIKFMMSSSSEEKAKYKKALEAYVVGCVVVFGAYGIWQLVVNTVMGVT